MVPLLVDPDSLSQFTRMVWGRTSVDWNQQSHPWVGNLGVVVLAAIGDSPIQFMFGIPGSHINDLRSDGYLWVFTDALLADVQIEHPEQQIGYPPTPPVTTVRVIPRSNLRSMTVRDANRTLAYADSEYGGWPTHVSLELDYGAGKPVVIEFTERNSNHQQKALLSLLPSLRADLGADQGGDA